MKKELSKKKFCLRLVSGCRIAYSMSNSCVFSVLFLWKEVDEKEKEIFEMVIVLYERDMNIKIT